MGLPYDFDTHLLCELCAWMRDMLMPRQLPILNEREGVFQSLCPPQSGISSLEVVLASPQHTQLA